MNIMHVKIDSLCFPESQEPALKNIDLQISLGEFIILTGPSGSGKSVLLNCLAGVIPLNKYAHLVGNVCFRGETITRLPETAGRTGLVTDNPQNQLFCTTVEEDLGFGPSNMLLPPPEIKRRITSALDFVDLPGYEKRKPETLSGGEMQRIVLASILTMNPEIILLDRPADQLDPAGRRNIYKNLRSLCMTQNKTVIVVEEMLEEIIPLADHIWVMEQGTVRQESLGDFPQYLVKQAKTKKPFLGQSSHKKSSPAIEVKNLNLHLEEGGFSLKNISLTINKGEFVALVGENGAGKTTLTKTFNGLLHPQEGQIIINGLDARVHSTAKLSGHVGYLFQNPLIHVCRSSVEEEIAFALKIKKFPKDEIKNKVSQALKDFGLADLAHIHPYKLTRSMLQKTALASVLISDPPILVIDEPTSQMCYEEAAETMELIAEFNQKGNTVIMITHNLKFALEFCHRFMVMKNGSLVLDADRTLFSDYLEGHLKTQVQS